MFFYFFRIEYLFSQPLEYLKKYLIEVYTQSFYFSFLFYFIIVLSKRFFVNKMFLFHRMTYESEDQQIIV